MEFNQDTDFQEVQQEISASHKESALQATEKINRDIAKWKRIKEKFAEQA